MWFSVLPTVKFLQYSSCSPGSMLFSAGEEARLRGMVRRRRRLSRLMGTTSKSCHLAPIASLQLINPPCKRSSLITFHISQMGLVEWEGRKCVSGFACSVAAGLCAAAGNFYSTTPVTKAGLSWPVSGHELRLRPASSENPPPACATFTSTCTPSSSYGDTPCCWHNLGNKECLLKEKIIGFAF